MRAQPGADLLLPDFAREARVELREVAVVVEADLPGRAVARRILFVDREDDAGLVVLRLPGRIERDPRQIRAADLEAAVRRARLNLHPCVLETDQGVRGLEPIRRTERSGGVEVEAPTVGRDEQRLGRCRVELPAPVLR